MQWDECEERKPDKRRTTRRRRGRQTVDSTTTGYGEWMYQEDRGAGTSSDHGRTPCTVTLDLILSTTGKQVKVRWRLCNSLSVGNLEDVWKVGCT